VSDILVIAITGLELLFHRKEVSLVSKAAVKYQRVSFLKFADLSQNR
jgi:hypothetical protein